MLSATHQVTRIVIFHSSSVIAVHRRIMRPNCEWKLAVVVAVVAACWGRPVDAHGWDKTFCEAEQLQWGPGKPNLPPGYSVRVEANILNKNTTTTLQEFYDGSANLASIHQVVSGMDYYYFYYYGLNEYLTVMQDTTGGMVCFRQNLSSNQNSEMFGIQTTANGSERIYSVYGALHFADGEGIVERYVGQETVRGINCNKWTSCQYWNQMDATSRVDWYFSAENQWKTISGYSSPVRCHVTGRVWDNSTSYHTFEHYYEFYDFRPLQSGYSSLEVPRNTYCMNGVNAKPMPKLPSAYSFKAELLDIIHNTMTFIKESYDNTSKLIRYESCAPGISCFSQIHDLNTGVAYVLDGQGGSCRPTMITPNMFDNVAVDSSHVRLRDPQEFMGLNYNFQYQGIHSMRGIDCDTWAALRYDYPNSNTNNPATIWTWYFATASWMQQTGFRGNLVMPVTLEIVTNGVPQTAPGAIHTIMHLYEYNAEISDILTYDISSCYGLNQSRNMAFLVPGSYADLVGLNLKLFKYFVLMAIQGYLGKFSPLRVSRLDIQEAGQNVLVTFDMLDKAPLSGDVLNPPQELTLDQAYSQLNTAINNGQLIIRMKTDAFSDLRSYIAKPVVPLAQGSSVQQQSGYSSGAMGGLAVGMLVLGALLGLAIMFVLYRVRGGTLGSQTSAMQRFDNDREQ